MNVEELLNYQMSIEEQNVWDELTSNLYNEFMELKRVYHLDVVQYERTLKSMLEYMIPSIGRKGYISGKGFYSVIAEDKGRRAEIEFMNESMDDMRIIMAKRISDAISYRYTIDDGSTILREKYGHLWKDIIYYDSPESNVFETKTKKHHIKNDKYIYPFELDYRKYQFDLKLLLVKAFIARNDFTNEIKLCENQMNASPKVKNSKFRWFYNEDSNEFELMQVK